MYLSERERRRLAELSRRSGTSQSELTRGAILDLDLDPCSEDDRAFALAGAAKGPDDSVADLDADELLPGFGE